MDDSPDKANVEARIQRLEERLSRMEAGPAPGRPSLHPAWPFLLGVLALVLGSLGLGYPRHYYHFLFSGLLLLLLYHRGFLRMADGRWRWPQLILNFLLFCLLFTFLIGGGISHPFDWLKMPVLTKTPPPADPSWYSVFIPDYTVQWLAVPKVSDWGVDITKIQTVVLLATFSGALFRFEPFTSITALALLILSVPAYLQYNWDWVVLFFIIGGVSIYAQSRAGTSRL